MIGDKLTPEEIGDNLDCEIEATYPCTGGGLVSTVSVDKLLEAQLAKVDRQDVCPECEGVGELFHKGVVDTLKAWSRCETCKGTGIVPKLEWDREKVILLLKRWLPKTLGLTKQEMAETEADQLKKVLEDNDGN